jgi:4-diphosphocytidyl-2-C-methyl-D-erythritol kinase
LLPPDQSELAALCHYLGTTRNDLLSPALGLAPQIGDKLALLRASDALYAQMSGSGATCFAIFANDAALQTAAARMRAEKPDWFVIATGTTAS